MCFLPCVLVNVAAESVCAHATMQACSHLHVQASEGEGRDEPEEEEGEEEAPLPAAPRRSASASAGAASAGASSQAPHAAKLWMSIATAMLWVISAEYICVCASVGMCVCVHA